MLNVSVRFLDMLNVSLRFLDMFMLPKTHLRVALKHWNSCTDRNGYPIRTGYTITKIFAPFLSKYGNVPMHSKLTRIQVPRSLTHI